MTDYEKYNAVIKSRLSEHRYIHSVNVSKAAVHLAKLNGANEEKAALAGILHDVMKEAPLDVQYEYIEKTARSSLFRSFIITPLCIKCPVRRFADWSLE